MKAVAFYKPSGARFASAEFKGVAPSSVPIIDPERMSDELRVDLLQKVRAGEVLALRVAIRAFGESPNANGIRPRPGSTKQLARNAEGLPFIQVHNMSGPVDERHGSLVKAKFKDGEVLILAELRRLASMEALVLNNLGEFSISYRFDNAECSKCATPAEIDWYGASFGCDCVPGSRFKDKETGERMFVELFTDGNQLEELSTVNAGAFPNTEIRSAFAAAEEGQRVCFSIAPPDRTTQRSEAMPTKKTEAQAAAPAEPKAEAVGKESQSVEFAAMKAQIEAANARALAAENAAFETIFNGAVEAFKCAPAQRDIQRETFGLVFKGDAARYAAHLDAMPANPAYGTEPIGQRAEMASSSAPAPTKRDRSELSEHAVRLGYASAASFERKYGRKPIFAEPNNPLDRIARR